MNVTAFKNGERNVIGNFYSRVSDFKLKKMHDVALCN